MATINAERAKMGLKPFSEAFGDIEMVPTRKAYVAGPMSGYPNYNFDTFGAVAAQLRAMHLYRAIINPAENFNGDQTLARHVYLAKAMQQVTSADELVLLPNWAASEGARLEVQLALNLGHTFSFAIKGKDEWLFYPASQADIRDILSSLKVGPEPAAVKPAEPERSIEQEAGWLVRDGDRAKTYGHPKPDFDRVAKVWSGLLNDKLTADITGEEVPIMMTGFKLCRLVQTPQHRDGKVDSIGYIITLDRYGEPADVA